ncbi:MAG: N-acetyltransferase family protein [Pseudomonadota bacterium]
MTADLKIRAAAPEDLPRLTAIYNHYIRDTHSTFDTREFSVPQRQAWFDRFRPGTRHTLLVGIANDTVVGYASSQPLRPKPAYDRSVETTVYLAPDCAGHGHGRLLYEALLSLLTDLGSVHRAYGVIALPNEASVHLHESLGFHRCSVLSEVGYKFGRYWDTAWYELHLSDNVSRSPE